MRDICIAISSIRNSTAATKSVAFWRLYGRAVAVHGVVAASTRKAALAIWADTFSCNLKSCLIST